MKIIWRWISILIVWLRLMFDFNGKVLGKYFVICEVSKVVINFVEIDFILWYWL